MKITLDIPDNTVAAYFVCLHGDIVNMTLSSFGIGREKLYDGSVINTEGENNG